MAELGAGSLGGQAWSRGASLVASSLRELGARSSAKRRVGENV